MSKPVIYIAASSLDIERAREWTQRINDTGIRVLSTWIDSITTVGESNPRTASASERMGWSLDDLRQIAQADMFWLLVPPLAEPSRGAWLELGYAYGCQVRVVSSGDTKQSIFCAIGAEYASDADAFDYIVARLDHDREQADRTWANR